MASPTLKIKEADTDTTVYERVTMVEQKEEFTIERLDQQIAQCDNAISEQTERKAELQAKKDEALALSGE